MDLFHRIDDAQAIVRAKGGVFKQAEVYRRRDRLYIKHGSGFIRITTKFGETWGTSAPNVNVVDITQDVPGMFVGNDGKKEPRWTGDHGAQG